MDSPASPSPPTPASSSSPLPPPQVDDQTTRQGLALLRAYLIEETRDEPWEDQVEATRRKQREKEKEDTLIEWGAHRPDAFLALLLPPFLVRSTRLAISGLLTHFLQASPGLSKHLANTPLLDAVLTSLQLDTSTTVFQLQVTILQVTLTGAPAALAEKLPEVFVILARAICWKERHDALQEEEDQLDPGGSGISVMRAPAVPPDQLRSTKDSTSDSSESDEEEELPTPRKVLDWHRLDFSFDSVRAPPPDTFPLLSYLYYIWPCNVLAFLRDPAKYLVEKDRPTNIEGKQWEDVFDRQEVGDASKALLRQLTIHPDILLFDSKSELLDHRKYKLTPREIIADTSLLRVVAPSPAEPLLRPSSTLARDGVSSVVPRPYDELVAERRELTFRKVEDDRKKKLNQVDYLVREVLMLENELMFEVYLKNFYIAHNKRLHVDVRLGAGALSEQQAFRNLLKNHEQTNDTLQSELRKLKERADTEKTNTKAKRDADLAKYTRTKEQLDKMTAQLTPLRNELELVKEDRALTKKELAEVKNERFELQNQLREIQPEVDAIHDFKEKIAKLEMVGKAAQGDRRVRRQQEEAIAEFDGKMIALQQMLDVTQRDQYAAEDQVMTLQDEITTLRSQNHTLASKLAKVPSATDSGASSSSSQPPPTTKALHAYQKEQAARMAAHESTITSLRSEILHLKVHIEELTEQLADAKVHRSADGKTIWEQATEAGGLAREGRRGSVQMGASGSQAARSASRERSFLGRRGSGGAAGLVSGGGNYRSTLGGGVMGVY